MSIRQLLVTVGNVLAVLIASVERGGNRSANADVCCLYRLPLSDRGPHAAERLEVDLKPVTVEHPKRDRGLQAEPERDVARQN